MIPPFTLVDIQLLGNTESGNFILLSLGYRLLSKLITFNLFSLKVKTA